MELTVLMPCLNEAETIESCINKAQKWMLDSGVSGEVIIADNGSTDGSQAISLRLGARVVSVSQRGYGAALFEGANEAHGKYIIMGDSDDSYDFSALDNFMSELRQGTDLVMGNRFLGGILPGAMPWKNRFIGNPVLTWIGRKLFGVRVRDFHCGLRGFSKAAFQEMELRTTGMEFASEMVIKASLLNMNIREVPTKLHKDGRTRPPHLKPWRDGWRHLRFMLSLSPKWLFLVPGTLLFFAGLALYIPLLFRDLSFGEIQLGVNTLFMAQTGFLLGYLAIVWGLAIRLFGIREGLLPSTERYDALIEKPVFEVGLFVSFLIITLGVLVSIQALNLWAMTSFGELATEDSVRITSVATTLLLFGGVSLFGSLMFGFLSLPMRRVVRLK